MWQDLVIAGVSFSFAFILLPQVRDSLKGKSYVNMITSSLSAIGLFILTMTFETMDMRFSALSALVTCIMWLILFGLSYRNYLVSKNEGSIIS